MTRKIIAIAAMDEERAIGANNGIPWNVPDDQKLFREKTSGHSVLMGRKTYFSLPKKYRPLPNRKNIVVTRDPRHFDGEPGVSVASSAAEVIESFRAGGVEWPSEILWIGGGQQIYEETVADWDEVYLTRIPGRHGGDTFFPKFEEDFELVREWDGQGCIFLHYKRSREG